jgi:[acyl-carrier-protein] S-malonyltransferase
MAPASDDLRASLQEAEFSPPAFAVWGNADAAPVVDPADALHRQLTSPVRFAESLAAMAADGIDTFVHIGPGDVTAGLVKRTVPDATVHVVAGLDAVSDVASAVQ